MTTANEGYGPARLVSRTAVSANEQALVIAAGGRDIPWVVLLPDHAADARRPLVVATHNFDGDAKGFAALIHAERLLERGIIVALPKAGGAAPDWQGPGLTILAPAFDADGRRPDDRIGVAESVAVLAELYPVDRDEVNLVGFSQGATLALAVARRMDAERSGAVRRLFLASGSLAGGEDATLALSGTDLFAYEPGHDLPQALAELRTGDVSEHAFLPALLKAKGCTLASRSNDGRLDRSDYACADGRRVVHIFEAAGEHAWPGQDAKYDSRLTGRGSISALDYTALIADAIAPRPR